jgi:FixJ family two-component response regulator
VRPLLFRVAEAIKNDFENRAKNSEHELLQKKMESLILKEKDVQIGVKNGYSNKEIATMMSISPLTVEIY